MRIVIAAPVSNQPEGGVANVVYNSAAELRKRGHEVTCLFREDTIPQPVAMPRFEAIYFAFRLAGILWKRKDEFDVVNIHGPVGFVYGFLRRLRPASSLPPYVMMLHGIEERRNYTMGREAKKGRAWYFGWKNRVWQRIYHMPLYRMTILSADHVMVINRETWTMLQLKYNREIGRVWYVPNGVEPQFFFEHEYGDGRALKLLFVGGWLDHKGVYYLRDGFEALAQRIPDLRLTVAGCTVDAETVKQWFSPSVRGRLDVLPFVSREEMPALYAQHDVFAFPSLFEGLPIVLLEAMATGMPVITTETCGMKDIVEDEYNGLLVKPADTEEFVAAVERMLSCPGLRARLGRAAQETMRRHTWERVAMQLETVFARAAEQSYPRRFTTTRE
jgi:glycosyltransferase involved in cell wall biosynthesis